MIKSKASIHIVGSLDSKTYYVDRSQKQFLVYRQASSSAASTLLFAPATATILGSFVTSIDAKLAIEGMATRLILIFASYLIMRLVATVLLRRYSTPSNLVPILMSGEKVRCLLDQAKKQVRFLQGFSILLYVVFAVLSLLLLKNFKMALFIPVSLLAFVLELMRGGVSLSSRKAVIRDIEQDWL